MNRTAARSAASVHEFLILLTVGWGVLAFGAVYPWAYWPLLSAAAVGGAWAFASGDATSDRNVNTFAIACVLIGVAVGLQLVPLPQQLIAAMSPARHRLLTLYNLEYAAGGGSHPLSINPAATQLALLCFLAFAVFCVGCARRLSSARAGTIARGIAILGVVVAVIGVVQKTSGTSMIYGFWQPIHHPYQIFGPFVNKNHYAGWMIMVLSLTLGSIGSVAAASARTIRPGWRDRLLWLSSPDANYILLAAVGTPIMMTALLMTLSRSGIAAWSLSVLAVGTLLASRTRRRGTAMAVTMAFVVVALALVIGWSRPEAVAERFEVGSGLSLAARTHAWRDALHIAKDFPLAGTGLNAFDTAMIFYQSQPGGHWDAAHNDYVQLLADGGVLLGVPIVVALVALLRLVSVRLREDRANPTALWLRYGAVTGLLAIGLQACFDFSLQLPGNAVMCGLLAAIAIHTPDQRR